VGSGRAALSRHFYRAGGCEWPPACPHWDEMDSSNVGHPGSLRPTLTFVLEESFESALKTLRRAFAEHQLCVTVELDAAKKIRRALNIVVSPCRILLVESPLFLLEATAIDRSSAVFLPLHVVVSGSGARTLIHVLSTQYGQLYDFPIGARIPLTRIQDQVLCALAKIADRTHGDELADRGSEPTDRPDVA
jgi:uncharacterized protein (DUF302 family)